MSHPSPVQADILHFLRQSNAPEASSFRALVSGAGNITLPGRGMYLGAAFPKRSRRGTYGRKIASWGSALQNSQGTTSFDAADLPPYADNATRVVVLTQHASLSFAQQSPPDAGQAYMPKGTSPGFTAGVWVKNPGTRTLNFELRLFNSAANRYVMWYGACEPTGQWQFITFSPSQAATNILTYGTDAIKFVRVGQIDNLQEGAWQAGETLKFGNVYVDVATRPRFCLTFDDGYASHSARNPGATSKVSGTAYVSSTSADVLTTAAAHALIVGESILFPETPPTGLSAGVTYYVKTAPDSTHFTLATDAALTTTASTTGFAGTANYQYGGSQARSVQELVESYGFRGSIFVVPTWLGTSGKYAYTGTVNSFMSAADVLAMWADGWAVGSHSSTHPSNKESAGLRLLGPYGYYLSNFADNLPAQYLSTWGLTGVRRRATSATQASPSVVTFESAHQFLWNQPIVWTDVAPTGFQVGVTYYVQSMPTATTATFATDQGTIAAGVNNTSGAWAGVANYRHPGSAVDDSAIYADVVAGAEGVRALGISTGYTFFALPQGGADVYVRSACIRAGIKWVRGVVGNSSVHTIPMGVPSGAGLAQVGGPSGGWMLQPDALATDSGVALSMVDTYVGDCIVQGACGCNYHHALAPGNIVALERLCQTLRAKSDAGLIDVLTVEELGRELGIA